MERNEKARYFFSARIKGLIDTIYAPVEELSDDYYLDNISRLRGAVWYAFEMGDIDSLRRRVLTDQLSDLYKVVLERIEKHAALSALNGDVTEGKVETGKGKGERK